MPSRGSAVNSTVVKTVEQNDPTTITGLGTASADAIVPFSAARLNLYNKGYFYNPSDGAGLPRPRQHDSAHVWNKPPHRDFSRRLASLKIGITDYFVWRANDAACLARPTRTSRVAR